MNGLDLRDEMRGDVTAVNPARSESRGRGSYFDRSAGKARFGGRDQGALGVRTSGAAERLPGNARDGTGCDRLATLRAGVVTGLVRRGGRDVFIVVRRRAAVVHARGKLHCLCLMCARQLLPNQREVEQEQA
jgi:hypothetical protein